MCHRVFPGLRELLPPCCFCGSSLLSEPGSKAISSQQPASPDDGIAFPASEGALTLSFLAEASDTHLPARALLVAHSGSDPWIPRTLSHHRPSGFKSAWLFWGTLFGLSSDCKESVCNAGNCIVPVQSLYQEDPLEKGIATHSSILA